MAPSLERSETINELRNIAENLGRERLEQSEVHPPVQQWPQTEDQGEVQESFRGSSAVLGNAEASEVDQPPPQTTPVTMDSPTTPVGLQAIPAFVILMTQEKTLEDLPSQMDFDWQDSVSPNPPPAVAGISEGSAKSMEVKAFVLVSGIAEEAAINATKHLPEQEAEPPTTNSNS